MCLAVPGKVITIEGDDPILRGGRVDFGGVIKDVNLSFVPDAGVGDYVLVHVGFAIGIVDEEEAQRTLSYLRELGDLKELEEAGG